MKTGKLNIVGIGPGNDAHITPAALQAIREAEFVIGYTTYIALVRHHLGGKQVTRTGMTEEISRARSAVETAAQGHIVTLISSGDCGVYGMAGLVFEVLREKGWRRGDSPEIQLLPGVTAANSCASLVGAPLIHDTCRISLSDLLTPWPVIEERIECAARADFVMTLYNPASGRRQRQIVEAARIIGKYRPATTPVALIKSAYRRQQNVVISDLERFLDFEIGMNTTVIVGSSNTFVYEGYMVTPRGHSNKYRIADGSVLEGQRRAQSLNCEGSIASRFAGDSAPPARELQITPIPGAFMKTVTERYEEESVEVDSLDSCDGEPSQESLDSSVASALSALALLSTKPSALLDLKPVSSLSQTAPQSALSSKPCISFGARVAGGLVFWDQKRCFLVGDLKEPCRFEEFGLREESGEKKGKPGKVRELEITDADRLARLGFNLLFDVEGEKGAEELYRLFAIYRNDSISERLMTLVSEYSPRTQVGTQEYIDSRWLMATPGPIWDVVRDTVLKCS